MNRETQRVKIRPVTDDERKRWPKRVIVPLEPEMLDFIVDDSPLKQGLYTPGMHIPVVPASELYTQRPDYVVVLAWNFARAIIQKHAAFREAGGCFIIPLPAVEIV